MEQPAQPDSAPASAPRRRLRDRLVAHETQTPALVEHPVVSNLLLLIDDDLHETAHAMAGIDGFLDEALRLLESPEVRPHELLRICANEQVMARMETLSETLSTLRRRFGALAASLR